MAEKTIRDLESLIEDGPNANAIGGFKAETNNGTATWRGTGWNWNPPFSMEPTAPKPVWPAGRSNRTGE